MDPKFRYAMYDTSPYPESTESRPDPDILFLYYPFQCYPPNYTHA
jgi:hypothetical protein